jgi:hypothetical protein
VDEFRAAKAHILGEPSSVARAVHQDASGRNIHFADRQGFTTSMVDAVSIDSPGAASAMTGGDAVTADANPTSAGPAPDNPGSFCIVSANCPGLWTIVDNPAQYSVAKNCPGLKRTCEKLTLQVAPVGIQMSSNFEAVYADAKKRNPVIGTQVGLVS